jgi:genome maintenance exonuclease 1
MSLALPQFSVKSVRQFGQQYYVSERGDRWPSVTAILNATRSAEQRQALSRWQQRVGIEVASEITRTASRRGTGTHKQVERYLKGEAIVCSDSVRPYWESILPVLQVVDDVRLIEGAVFHADLGYAGKVDCIASYEGTPCLCEWKTADRPKQSLDRLHDYPLQVAAYWGAVNHCYRDYAVDLKHALLTIALPGLPAEVFWFDAAAIAPYWEIWEERVAQFWRRQGRSL